MTLTPVRSCPNCRTQLTLYDLALDPQIRPLGLTFNGTDLSTAYYCFQHEKPQCGTTFLIDVERFAPLIDELIPDRILAGNVECNGHCVRIDDLEVCESECHMAPYRRFLMRMLKTKACSAISGTTA